MSDHIATPDERRNDSLHSGAAQAEPGWHCTAADLAIAAPAIPAEALCPQAFGMLDANPSWPALCIVDKNQLVIGLLTRRVCMSILSKPLMLDLYSRRSVSLIMHASPLVVDLGESVDNILEKIAEEFPDALLDGFALTRDGHYAGVATPQLLMMRSVEQSRRRALVLDNAHKETVRALEQVGMLLNNSGQGFLSFTPDLIVAEGFSQACVHLLGRPPAGMTIDELLFPRDTRARKLLRECVEDVLKERRHHQRKMYLSLIPSEIRVFGKVLEAEYVPIETGIMVILSDVTDERALTDQLERESRRMEMIVAAVTDAGDFFAAVDEFRTFVTHGAQAYGPNDGALLYRDVHTFKGTFNQLGFHHVPTALHGAESGLSEGLADGQGQAAAVKVFTVDWNNLLDRDLLTLSKALGHDFIERRGVVTLSPEQAKRFESYAVARLKDPALSDENRPILQELASIRLISLQSELREFNRLIRQVAARLEKEVNPLVLEGEDVLVDPDLYGPFLRNLGHLFRNAVDHGIEDPDTRLNDGKDESGTITCRISRHDETLVLDLSDDGGGINEDALRQRAAEKLSMDVAQWPIEELVFADGLSSREVATELSGRGIGLGALRAAVHDLNGNVRVVSRRGLGTSFIFTFPFPST